MDAIATGVMFLGRRPARRFVEVARSAEDLGFDFFWIPDERFFREVYSLCSLVAGVTERMLIGPCVTDPYTRHPALTAMAIGTLDEISGGRAVLGLGAGISGFAELGLERVRPARAMAETIGLVRALLAGESARVDGAVISFEGKLDFTPPRAGVPVYLAAAGPRMLELAGALAEGVIIEGCAGPGALDRPLEHVQRGLERAGRALAGIDVVARLDVAVDDSLERAYDVLRPRLARSIAGSAPGFTRYVARGIDLPAAVKNLAHSIGYTHDPDRLRPLAALVPEAVVDQFTIAATPATLPERLDRLVAGGATQILVNPIPVCGDEVEPVLDAVAAWARERR
jgi:5,10-methylenetetrahydromethanopterin reductase